MNFRKLDEFIDQLPMCGIPESDFVVTQNGKTIYRHGSGYSDAAKTKPVSNRDLYWIYSTTKIVTCIAAMRLVEEGKLELDDLVSKYIPAFGEVQVLQKDGTLRPATTPITVRHLFTMTSGMNYDRDTEAIRQAVNAGEGTVGIVAAMAKTPLQFEPGTRYLYSLSHDALGAVVEVVSGMRLSDYLKTIIFRPLGITDMGFFPNEEQKERIAAQYTYHNATGTCKEIPNVYSGYICDRYESAGGGLFASVDEYIKIISTVACGGTTADGYRLLKPQTIGMMQKNLLSGEPLSDFVGKRLFGYGWGLCGRVHINPLLSRSLSPVGEFGWNSMANAFAWIDTENRIAAFYGCHVQKCSFGSRIVHPTLRNLVYEGLKSE
ncbi:MAG: beta-lactamase family protein [Clostridia bacterium]|nr:beta-lactamase family protein [Clostridia bacterium]